MNWSQWIRQTHRWLSIAFTAAVIANLVALAMQEQTVWVGLMALFPLILLMLTGLYMFVLPYTAKRRSGQPEHGRGSSSSGPTGTTAAGQARLALPQFRSAALARSAPAISEDPGCPPSS